MLKRDSVCTVCTKNNALVSHANLSLWQQVREFFAKLFDTASWPPRWHCGTWTDFHGWLYIFSDLLIWASYFAIPVLLFSIIIKRKDIPFLRIFWLFIAFILLCGTTHFLDAVIFWWPAYRLSALIRFLTAVVSVVTVYALYNAIPFINNLRTVDQLEHEIEERKRAEQQVEKQRLEQVATQELMNRKDEFMSIASHELKTPITSVKASLQLLDKMVMRQPDLESMAPFINKASKQVNKLTDIINDLLDVTKIQAGRLQLNKSFFNLSQLITECIEQCQLIDNRHKIVVTGNDKLKIYADHDRLEQVFCNLINNAIKYSPESDQIDVRFDSVDDQIKVSVTDYGIGIPAEKIDNIFDRFFRVEHTSQNFAGLGLGLYISSEIIKQHDGQIGVTSERGKGSSFWFVLPG